MPKSNRESYKKLYIHKFVNLERITPWKTNYHNLSNMKDYLNSLTTTEEIEFVILKPKKKHPSPDVSLDNFIKHLYKNCQFDTVSSRK